MVKLNFKRLRRRPHDGCDLGRHPARRLEVAEGVEYHRNDAGTFLSGDLLATFELLEEHQPSELTQDDQNKGWQSATFTENEGN